MSNSTFKNIDEFIDGFTKTKPYEESLFDVIIWGMEFVYLGNYYRLTRDRSADDETFIKICEKFGKPYGNYIEVYSLPCEDHKGRYQLSPDIYLGLYEDVNDMLDNCVISGKTLREIIPSPDTRICSID